MSLALSFFFFQAEDGIRVLVRSRGLGDVYKRQDRAMRAQRLRLDAQQPLFDGVGVGDHAADHVGGAAGDVGQAFGNQPARARFGDGQGQACLLYTSDAADDLLCVDLGGRRILKKKKRTKTR